MKHAKKIGALSMAAAPAGPAAPSAEARTQTEKALALINTFATGDTETAASLLAEGYIQHNRSVLYLSGAHDIAASPPLGSDWADQNLPLLFCHADSSAMVSITSQCSAILPFSTRHRS